MSAGVLHSDRTDNESATRLALARHTSTHLGRSHVPHLAAAIAVIVYFAGHLMTNAIFWWGGAALLNIVRAAACNRSDRLHLDRGEPTRWYTPLNTGYFFVYGAIWGALPVVTGRYGSGSDVWIGFVVMLGLVSLTAVVTASSRLFYGATLTGALLSTTFGLLIGGSQSDTVFPLLLLYFAAAWWLHATLHQAIRALVVSDLENRQLADRLSSVLEYQDPLTRLLNRDGLTPWLAAWHDSERGGQHVAVAVGNVERLSAINELFGVEQGDLVLQSIARRLEDLAGHGAAVCRLAGDEFAIAAPVFTDSEGAGLRDVLERCMFEPIGLGDRTVPVKMTTAVVVGDPRDFEQLIISASSLVRDERSRRSPSLTVSDGHLGERRDMLTELRSGLTDGSVTPWFQPLLACNGIDVQGWEALVRWQHPTRGLIPPVQFLGLAEVGGFMNELTDRVIESSIQFVAQLATLGHHRAACVHVNLSASEARRPDLPRFFQECLASFGVRPSAVTIEITENEVTRVEGDLLSNLQQFESMGIGLAIDDFGTGYSSLSHLLDLRATEVKIDKRFIDGLPDDRTSSELVRAVLGLARGLGMRTVAEGVETREQRTFLEMAGCDTYQGYLTAPALCSADAVKFLTHHSLTG